MTVVALAGSPNAGKSSLFNTLTGARQKVGNYPGVTVEKKFGTTETAGGDKVLVIDLPGTYSLDPASPDEEIAVKVLLNQDKICEEPDLIVAVADATNLERTLGLILDLKKIGRPVVAALNMMDLATRRGLKLQADVLEKELGVPVVPTVAVRKDGVTQLLETIDQVAKRSLSNAESQKTGATQATWARPNRLDIIQRQQEVDRILDLAILERTRRDIWTRRLDRLLLHPVLGVVCLVGLMLMMFQAVYSWAEAPMEWIETGIAALGSGVGALLSAGVFHDLIVDGVIAGVGAVVVFLPQILILFLFIFLLEGSGYMARAAFILDRMMSAVGLQGRAFVPLLSSFACAIPGIMAARTIKDPTDRLLTILVAPLMTCSARLPVYVLLIGAFIPNTPVLGPLRMQGLVMFGLFVFAILCAMVVAYAFKRTSFKGPKAPFLMELPTYKWPNPRYVAIGLWMRTKAFMKRAGKIILFVAMGLWFLSSYPQAPADYDQPAINYSFAGRIGHTLEPLFAPMGFDWRISTGLIPGFAAREVMVGALGTVFAVEDAEEEGLGTLQEKIASTWPISVGLALLAWYIFAPQCLATFAVARRETNGWKWPTIMFVYMLALAYGAAALTYQVVEWMQRV